MERCQACSRRLMDTRQSEIQRRVQGNTPWARASNTASVRECTDNFL